MAESSNQPTERGFSLLEILITAVIIGALAAVAVPVVNNIRGTGSSGAASGSVSSLVNEFQIAYTLGEDIVTDTNPTISDRAIPIYTDRSGREVARSVGGLEAVDAGFDGSAITCLSGQQDGYIATWTAAAGITVTPGDTLTCTNTPANTGQNGTGSGTESSSPPAEVPNLTAPSDLAVTSEGDQEVTISFTDQGAGVNYQYRLDGSGDWTNVSPGGGTAKITSLTNGQEYGIELRAVSGSSQSDPSPSVTAIPTTGVGTLTVTRASPMSVSWKPVNDAEAYKVRITHNGATSELVSSNVTETSVEHAFSGGYYIYNVTPVFKSGKAGNLVTVTRPDAPTNVSAVRTGTDVTVRWKVPGYDGGSPINKWFFEYRIGTGTWTRPTGFKDGTPGDSTLSEYTFTNNLIPATATQVRILAQNNPGPSSWATVNITN